MKKKTKKVLDNILFVLGIFAMLLLVYGIVKVLI